jgi:hypothetical protein
MKYLLSAILLGAMALNAPITFAEDKPATEDHQIHHPDEQKKEVKAAVSATRMSGMQGGMMHNIK